MTDARKTEQLTTLKALHDQGLAAGLLARVWGYGVLVLCLPEYDTPTEQLLLQPTPQDGGQGNAERQSTAG